MSDGNALQPSCPNTRDPDQRESHQHVQNADRHMIHTDFRSVPGSSEWHEHRQKYEVWKFIVYDWLIYCTGVRVFAANFWEPLRGSTKKLLGGRTIDQLEYCEHSTLTNGHIPHRNWETPIWFLNFKWPRLLHWHTWVGRCVSWVNEAALGRTWGEAFRTRWFTRGSSSWCASAASEQEAHRRGDRGRHSGWDKEDSVGSKLQPHC